MPMKGQDRAEVVCLTFGKASRSWRSATVRHVFDGDMPLSLSSVPREESPEQGACCLALSHGRRLRSVKMTRCGRLRMCISMTANVARITSPTNANGFAAVLRRAFELRHHRRCRKGQEGTHDQDRRPTGPLMLRQYNLYRDCISCWQADGLSRWRQRSLSAGTSAGYGWSVA